MKRVLVPCTKLSTPSLLTQPAPVTLRMMKFWLALARSVKESGLSTMISPAELIATTLRDSWYVLEYT